MKKILSFSLLSFALVGCAATYVAPTTTATVLNQSVKANKTELLKATSVALALDGIKISSENKDTGIIVTEDKVFRVTPEMADCGTTMGIDYLKDNRTNTKVSYHIIVSDNSLKIKASPSAEYRVGGTVQDLNLTCVSKGVLEQRLYESIIQNL
ncbi:hypothetical protein ACG9WR_01475 [Acinetobacter pittii]|uniref:hypothetical protein n=1 Tax=Acinetobacter pittii TaxID=48296 RepID=UPI003AF65085